MESTQVSSRLESILREIEGACQRSGRRTDDVTLVAVSKKQPLALMKEYAAAAKARKIQAVFGESYVQELKAKRAELNDSAQFHLLGPLQRNKVRDAVKLSDVIQSVHTLPVLEAVAAEARKAGKVQSIFLQVNISRDESKSGFDSGTIVSAVAAASALSDAVSLEGLMTITALYDSPEDARGDFRRMAALRNELTSQGHHEAFQNSSIKLSMGMSADFAVAIEEGANLVRVGTALFGERE